MSSTDTTKQTSQPTAKPGDPCAMVIFGASGDLTRRKLIPALCNLARDKLLPEQFVVVGVSRSEMTKDEFGRKVAPDSIEPEVWSWLERRLDYLSGDSQ